jgi:hypothetical protein
MAQPITEGERPESIGITPRLPANQRDDLEQILFFNANQHRVRLGIQLSIETYGAPAIHVENGLLRIRVGEMPGVENLFAVSATGRLLGVAVFACLADERFVVLHLGLQARRIGAPDVNAPVLRRLMYEIRRAARLTRGVDRIELVYKDCHSMRVTG